MAVITSRTILRPNARELRPAAQAQTVNPNLRVVSLYGFLRNLSLLLSGQISRLPHTTHLPWSHQAHILPVGKKAAYLFSPLPKKPEKGLGRIMVTANINNDRDISLLLYTPSNPYPIYELIFDREESLFYFNKQMNGQPHRVYLAAVPPNRNIRLKGLTLSLNESFEEGSPILLAFDRAGNFIRAFHDEKRPLSNDPLPVFRDGKVVAWLLTKRPGSTGMREISGQLRGFGCFRKSRDQYFLEFGGKPYALSQKQMQELGLKIGEPVNLNIEQGHISAILGPKPLFPILISDKSGRILDSTLRHLSERYLTELPVCLEGIWSSDVKEYEAVFLLNKYHTLKGGDNSSAPRQVSILLEAGPNGPTIVFWESGPRFADRAKTMERIGVTSRLRKIAERFQQFPRSLRLAQAFADIYREVDALGLTAQLMLYRELYLLAWSQFRGFKR